MSVDEGAVSLLRDDPGENRAPAATAAVELAGLTALVTGAGRRIGAACAEALAAAGARVAVHCHHATGEADALCTAIRRRGGEAQWFQADLADTGQTAGLMAQVEACLGPVRILVNNASLFRPGTLRATPLEAWQREMAINLTAPFLLMQAFAAALAPTKTGTVVNLLDQRIVRPPVGHLAYTVAKSALWTLTQMAAIELAPAIRVNAIAPGPILPASGAPDAHFHAVVDATPLKRVGTPQDVTETLLFLVRQSMITGEMICVDGGEHL